ncbi:hypothetical protein [Burkholderia stagnalis]|uniref:hypothetical protein n=1 Tax=Burkholderia stagnalis TaxID=1503054 RepID=UPI000B199CBC|nr:hypothetical protein [Burkholderia stagnalis]
MMKSRFAARCRAALLARYQDETQADAAIAKLEALYETFLQSGCADRHFERELASENPATFAQRLGELLLFERLSHAGFSLSSVNDGPDFRAELDGQIVWFELVTPSAGEDTRIAELFELQNPLYPDPNAGIELSERCLLRICAGIAAKLNRFEEYLKFIKPTEACVIVVNDALLCPNVGYYGLSHGADNGIGGESLVRHAVFGVDQPYWEKEVAGGQYKIVERSREEAANRPEPTRDGTPRKPVPVTLFGSPESDRPQVFANRARVISAAMQVTLREDCGVLMTTRDKAEHEDRLAEILLHRGHVVPNPNAQTPLPASFIQRLSSITNLPPPTGEEIADLRRRYFGMVTGRVLPQG